MLQNQALGIVTRGRNTSNSKSNNSNPAVRQSLANSSSVTCSFTYSLATRCVNQLRLLVGTKLHLRSYSKEAITGVQPEGSRTHQQLAAALVIIVVAVFISIQTRDLFILTFICNNIKCQPVLELVLLYKSSNLTKQSLTEK